MERRTQRSDQERYELVQQVNSLRQNEGISAVDACGRLGIPVGSYNNWATKFRGGAVLPPPPANAPQQTTMPTTAVTPTPRQNVPTPKRSVTHVDLSNIHIPELSEEAEVTVMVFRGKPLQVGRALNQIYAGGI